jgi:hypothetical protein
VPDYISVPTPHVDRSGLDEVEKLRVEGHFVTVPVTFGNQEVILFVGCPQYLMFSPGMVDEPILKRIASFIADAVEALDPDPRAHGS